MLELLQKIRHLLYKLDCEDAEIILSVDGYRCLLYEVRERYKEYGYQRKEDITEIINYMGMKIKRQTKQENQK